VGNSHVTLQQDSWTDVIRKIPSSRGKVSAGGTLDLAPYRFRRLQPIRLRRPARGCALRSELFSQALLSAAAAVGKKGHCPFSLRAHCIAVCAFCRDFFLDRMCVVYIQCVYEQKFTSIPKISNLFEQAPSKGAMGGGDSTPKSAGTSRSEPEIWVLRCSRRGPTVERQVVRHACRPPALGFTETLRRYPGAPSAGVLQPVDQPLGLQGDRLQVYRF
jgi:hypothetical protein